MLGLLGLKRKRRNRGTLSLLLAVLLCLASGFVMAAYADDTPDVTIDQCVSNNAGFQPSDLTKNVVTCIKSLVQDAVYEMLGVMSDYLKPAAILVMVLAVMGLGHKLILGETHAVPQAVGLLLKIGFVWFFCQNLGGTTTNGNGFADDLFKIQDQLMNLVTNSTQPDYSPWKQLDTYVGNFFGFSPDRSLFQGILGLVAVAIFSGSTGFTIFAAAAMAIMNLMLFMLEIVYAYLSAVLVLGFLIILSPFMVPLAMFQYTDRYFRKYVDAIIASLFVPMFLFGFLSSTLSLINQPMTNALNVLDPSGNNDFRAYWRTNVPVGSLAMQFDPNLEAQIKEQVKKMNSSAMHRSPVQTFLNPEMHWAFNPIPTTVNEFDFGPNSMQKVQKLIIAFASLWLYASLMKGMVRKMPDVAAEIAGATTGILIMDKPMQQRVAEVKDNVKVGGGAVIGGNIGDRIGKAAKVNRTAATEAGALMGMLVGRRI